MRKNFTFSELVSAIERTSSELTSRTKLAVKPAIPFGIG